MTVSELIAQLTDQDPDAIVVIERGDEYWHVADIDTAVLVDPEAINPDWNYQAALSCEPYEPNAVRICV